MRRLTHHASDAWRLCTSYTRSLMTPARTKEHTKSTAETIGDCLAITCGLGGLFMVAHMQYRLCQPRETVIRARALPIADSALKTALEPTHEPTECANTAAGTLVNRIVKDPTTGKRYLKKGAKDRKSLVREFVIANALALVRPGVQPETLLSQEDFQADGTARFYTLSYMPPNSMDLEAFVKSGKLEERLAKRPLSGFETALAADALFAMQQDCKLANLVIIKLKDRYVVISIDHEMAGENFFSLYNRHMVTTDFDTLTGMLRDTHPKDPDVPPVGMCGDPRAAAFVKLATPHMDAEAIIDFYRSIAATDFTPLLMKLTQLSEHSDIVTHSDIRYYSAMLKNIKYKSKMAVEQWEAAHSTSLRP